MSADVVIRAEGLGKKYVIGHQSSERYVALRDVIARSAKTFARTATDMLRGRAIYAGDELEEFWALRDVNFEIRQGEVVGIIGRNGAGKSTLLKILSRITEPSTGRVEIKGRVASLLEVGTGFHPELTGRENIFLNGAILGMSRAEVQRKFEEIVEFAGVEKFLDTPVKRYSSGMYVRLAFSVAASLDADILIVDEVLAVGDAEFQKKCLGKMGEVATGGRTVIFVSHQMDAIERLCGIGICMDSGSISTYGAVHDITSAYKAAQITARAATNILWDGVHLGVTDPQFIHINNKTELYVSLTADRVIEWVECCMIIATPEGGRVCVLDLRCSDAKRVFEAGIKYNVAFRCDELHLVGRSYVLSMWLCTALGGINIDLGLVDLAAPTTTKQPLSMYPSAMNGVVAAFGEATVSG